MWIRNQWKNNLVNSEHFYIETNYVYCVTSYGKPLPLGYYSTEKKALEVLDTIADYVVRHPLAVFKMPQDDEVMD